MKMQIDEKDVRLIRTKSISESQEVCDRDVQSTDFLPTQENKT